MAANPPPAPYPAAIVYRAARNNSWIKQGVVKHLAFYRRDSDTDGMSVADTVEGADEVVQEHFGIIQIETAGIVALRLDNDEPPIRLAVHPKENVAAAGNINTAVPFRSDPNPEQAGLAIAIATALASIATPTNHPRKERPR